MMGSAAVMPPAIDRWDRVGEWGQRSGGLAPSTQMPTHTQHTERFLEINTKLSCRFALQKIFKKSKNPKHAVFFMYQCFSEKTEMDFQAKFSQL